MSLSAGEVAAILSTPALAPPPGVTPNFNEPPNKNALAWFVTTTCMVVATLCVLLRGYAKIWLTRKIEIEEVLMVLAYGAYWGTAFAGYSLIFTPGYYAHQWNLHSGDLVQPLYLILVYGCAYSVVLPLLKAAILLDWCRIFVPSNRTRNSFWWGCMFIIFVQVSWGLACIILLNMQCVPHAVIWKFYLPSKCYSLHKVMLTSACVQVFSDWCMVLLPHRVIWRLQMNRQKKIGISVLFGVGIMASISASLRLSTTITFAKEPDQMYFIGALLFCACAEMTCCFFIFCVPCILAVIKQTGLAFRLKRLLGISLKANEKVSDPNHPRSTHGMHRSDMESTNVIEFDENSTVSLGRLEASESQEHLRPTEAKSTMYVTRITYIDVSSATSVDDQGRELQRKVIPWIKELLAESQLNPHRALQPTTSSP
ncbi:hypothetical protein ONS95_010911 [Cadophora gregata]|uniref:uncharacterized protein n=1 Tax=Cadophora gregata TaxID=51156 RepID=UPI0026DD02B4|nr:uncharacterized protein ONS95_010911 [Cadophora gregata]KAK0119463.1 hypothetical protein ONS95_010911 [Cadophora gregata]